jgi:hypothetical protein
MKTLEEQIAVMLAFKEGKEIEHRHPHFDWEDDKEPIWDWSQYDYRVKEDWLTPEELKRLPVDTLLLVSDEKDTTPDERYFSHYENGIIRCFYNGATSQTNKLEHYGGWRYAKLCKNAKSSIQWHKNTGKMPDCKKVLVRFNDDTIMEDITVNYDWRVKDKYCAIKEYAIIE